MKRRVSASVDDELLAAAELAVREGHAPTVSALVEQALQMRLEQARRADAMDELLAGWDEERGPMSDAEADRIAEEWRAASVMVGPDAGAAERNAA